MMDVNIQAGCYCTYKGTEFIANHNAKMGEIMHFAVVIAPTKVLNF